MQTRRLELALTSLTFIAFAVFLLASNSFDWGYFYSASEVDLRSWMIDGQAPLWSYQLCAGSSRLGDPQAFGLSPLFLLVILFGPILGLKLLVWLSALAGFFALRSIGRLAVQSFGRTVDPGLLSLLALCTVFGNYFLWHLHVGHVTFALMYLVFVLISLFLRACFGHFRTVHAAAALLLSFAYFSAGFSGSLIYLFIPAGLSLLSGLWLQKNWMPVVRYAVALALGALCAVYKIFGVANYQSLFPRTLAADTDYFSLGDFFQALLVPTFHSRYVLGARSGDWGLWEYSSFSLTIYILLACTVYFALKRRSLSLKLNYFSVWMLSLLALGLSVLMPADLPLSLAYWTNFFLHNSVRVFSRFQVIWLLLIFLAAVVAVSHIDISLRIRRLLWLGLAPLLIVNFFTFKSLSVGEFGRAMATDSEQPAKMNQLYWVPSHPLVVRIMYPALRLGALVPNCYQPMNKKTLMTQPPKTGFFPLIGESSVPSCRANSWVTQNEVHLDASCPVGTCVNLNDVNLYSPPDRLAFDADKNRWCVRE